MTAPYLEKQGISPALRQRYIQANWMESAGHGAYRRPGDIVDWLGGVYTLQKQLGLMVYPGGKTALLLKGASHFVTTGLGIVFLYGRRGDWLPTWFRQYPWLEDIMFKPITLFEGDLASFMTDHRHKELNIKIANRELASLEMLYHVPARQGFVEAYSIMENLATLRPIVVQELLARCRSIKVKRLFLFMANKAGHPWYAKLDLDQVDLGQGKRVIVKGGVLDKAFGITVPKELAL